MKLKGKIILAYFLIITVPTMVVGAVAGTVVVLQINTIRKIYDIDADTFHTIANPIQILSCLTKKSYHKIKLLLLQDTQQFQNKKFIDKLEKTLKDKYSFIMVRKNGKYLYIGDKGAYPVLYNRLPKFNSSYEMHNMDLNSAIYMEGRRPFLVKAQDFYFLDGGKGTVFIITDLNGLIPQMRSVVIKGSIEFVVILGFLGYVFAAWLYRSIIKPLNILKIATGQLKNGNLNYSISTQNKDEIGQLCDDFEEMRIHLKELIEGRLEEEEDIKEIISNISHDLKTPLTAIKGYAEGLMDGVADTPKKQDKYLRTIYTKANNMSAMVDELLLYAKIDSNRVPYNFKHINLHKYFEEGIEKLKMDLEEKNIELTYQNDTDPAIQVMADAEQLKRVVNNVIGNSIKYMDKRDGKINIRIHDIGTYEQIEIRDNGAGISEEEISKIFERFYRADESRNSKKGGSGLGLAIAKKIIEDHSGKIWAESKGGLGTSIFFTLQKVEVKEADQL
jgi:signal transduction histidine kinase